MRLLLAAAAIAATAIPAFAETDEQRAERCAAQADIVGQAIELRLKNHTDKEVEAAILKETDKALAPSVPLLVGFVYTLADEDMQQDYRAAFEEQCNGYKP